MRTGYLQSRALQLLQALVVSCDAQFTPTWTNEPRYTEQCPALHGCQPCSAALDLTATFPDIKHIVIQRVSSCGHELFKRLFRQPPLGFGAVMRTGYNSLVLFSFCRR
ncbi:hypothetical protein MTO96_022554 [Rhipicephalus appendiculatus]